MTESMKMADLPGRVYGWEYWDRQENPAESVAQKYLRVSREDQLAKGRERSRRSYEKRREEILRKRAAKRGALDFAPGFRGRYHGSTDGTGMNHERSLAVTGTGLDG